jgi:hypothetical protein
VAAQPLSTLLSQVVVAFSIELDNEFERRFRESGGGARVASLTVWSNFLRFVGDGITIGELVAVAGLPKRSVLSRVGGAERWRYVSVGSSSGKREGYGSGRGVKEEWVVQLTSSGRRAAEIWAQLPREIDERWRQRFGSPAIDGLVRKLKGIDERIDVNLPEYLPVVSSTNDMALELGEQKQEARVDEPLVVLLAHVLMAYTLDFEEGTPLPLPLSANVLRVLDADGVPVRDLPSLTGISKEAVEVSLTSLSRTEYVLVEGAPASKRVIRLTPAGRQLRADQRRLHDRIEKRWHTRFGADTGRLRAGLERILDHPELSAGLTPPPDGWRASKPYAKRTQALLADPRGQLPHCPMVLPRGGWPDGS